MSIDKKFDAMIDYIFSNAVGNLSDDEFNDALAVIHCFKFINSKKGQATLSQQELNSVYWCKSKEIVSYVKVGIPIHCDQEWKLKKKSLDNLINQFIYSFELIKNTNNGILFFKKLNGNCIEGRTPEALLFASNLLDDLIPFNDLMKVYLMEAEKLNINKKEEILEFILERYSGVRCANSNGTCDNGLVTKGNVKTYLDYLIPDQVKPKTTKDTGIRFHCYIELPRIDTSIIEKQDISPVLSSFIEQLETYEAGRRILSEYTPRFFSWIPLPLGFSKTEKLAAVQALVKVLKNENEDDANLTFHLPVLRNGQLGSIVREFVKKCHANSIEGDTGKVITTVREFIRSLS